MRNFHTDNELALGFENDFELYLQRHNYDYTKTPHTYWMELHQVDSVRDCAWEYDFIVKGKGVELKSLEGSYPTAVIEKWADDGMSILPGWRKSTMNEQLDYVVIERRCEGRWYFYDAKKLYEAVSCYPDTMLTQCWNANTNAPGYIVKFPWEDEDFGYISSVSSFKNVKT